MVEDARFEDAAKPVRLKAESVEDLTVLSALLQDAVGKAKDFAFLPKRRRFIFVVNRYRWEDGQQNGPGQRVQTGVTVENALKVRAKGVAPGVDKPVEILDLAWAAGEDGAGSLHILCAGGAEFAIEAEALDVALADITKPWAASARPRHPGA